MVAVSPFSEENCRLCGAEHADVYLQRPRFVVRRCQRCTTMWCDPLRFNDSFNPDNEDAYLEVDDAIAAENADRVAFVGQFAPSHTHPIMAEIGCMHGDFVEQANRLGYQATGYDLSETAVDWAATHRPGLVRYGTLDETHDDGSLDVVAGFNVVEHMDDPGAFLDHVSRVLRPGGVFVAETPSAQSLYHAILFARGFAMQRRSELEIGMHPGTHIFKFGKTAWRRVLERRGFEVLGIQPKSTALAELLAKNRDRPIWFRGGIVGFGLLARATGLGNRVLVAARWRGR